MGLAAMCLLALLMAGVCARADGPALVISEACGDNDFVWSLNFEDYIEVHNPGTQDVQLGDYCLRVKKKTVRLPDVTLAPGAYHVIVCDGDAYPSLSKSGFTATLVDARGGTVDSVSVTECKNQVWLRGEGLSHLPSPGYENTAAGNGQWHRSVQGELRINEALSANFIGLRSKARGTDALELLCTGDKNVQLGQYYLSDDRDDLMQYQLPEGTLRPGGILTVLCTDDEDAAERTGFKLSAGGERIYLSDASGRIVDVLNLPPLTLDVSYGWAGEELGYFTAPTIGRENDAAALRGLAEPPVLSVASSGGHDQPFTVTITGQQPIRYTLDGSDPVVNGRVYEGPLTIKGSTALRAVSMPEGLAPSLTATAVYRFDTADYDLPCAFITVDPSGLTSSQYGLMKHPEDKDLEVPAHVTLLGTEGEEIFSLGCGLSIAGQTSRVRPNRGWKVTFREHYGAENVGVKVYDNLDVTTFDSFVFRLGTTGNPIHDILATAVGRDAAPAVLHQSYRPVNLFIGDTYYGVYYLREHVNKNFVANHLGGSEKQVDIVYNVSEAKEGSSEDWVALMEYCATHDLAVQEHYEYVAARINVESFMDYFIWRPYTGDTDHPNIRYVRVRDAQDPRWHIIIYDMDWAFQKRSISMDKYTYQLYQEPRHNNVVIHALLQNPGFREQFLNRLAVHMNATFDPARVNGLLDGLLAETSADMPKHLKRWSVSQKAYDKLIADIRTFIGGSGSPDRRTLLLQETQRFFQLTDEEMQRHFGSIPY